MRLIIKNLAAAAVLAVVSHTPAFAEPGDRLFQMIDACRDDYHRFCPGVTPGGGRILSCLNDYKPELSPVCYKAFTVAAAVRACTEDFHRFCPGVEPGEDRAVQCLGDHADDVSDHCSRSLTAALAQHRTENTSAYGYREPPRHERRYDEKRYSEDYRRDEHSRYSAPSHGNDDDIDEEREPETLK